MDLRKTGDADRRIDRPDMYYPFFYNEKTKELRVQREGPAPEGFFAIYPTKEGGEEGRWRWGFDTSRGNLNALFARPMPKRGGWSVFEMDYLAPDEQIKPTSVWDFKDVNSERGSEQLIELGFKKEDFPRPKPVGLLKRIVQIATGPNDIVLDFFAGSGTTAQAVLDLNREDGANRTFVLVQLPEPISGSKFSTIAEITKERVRRVLKQEAQNAEGQLALAAKDMIVEGFRVFKLAESNFKVWDANAAKDAQQVEEQLVLNVDHLRAGRKAPDFLYEILLKSGFPLTAKVETLKLADKPVFSIAGGALLVCLERELTLDLIRAMADLKPERVVCLDEGFASNDQLKTNAVQSFKTKGVVFRTV